MNRYDEKTVNVKDTSLTSCFVGLAVAAGVAAVVVSGAETFWESPRLEGCYEWN